MNDFSPEIHQPLTAYQSTMMGFLLFQPSPQKLVLIGVHDGKMICYCLEHFSQATVLAVDSEEHISLLKAGQHIPANSSRLSMYSSNPAVYMARRSEPVDAILVDCTSQPTDFLSAGFFDNCYARLNREGVLAVRLDGGAKFGAHAARVRESFEGQVVVVDADTPGNKVAFGFKGEAFPPNNETLLARVRLLEPGHPVGVFKTAQKVAQRLRQRSQQSGDWDRL